MICKNHCRFYYRWCDSCIVMSHMKFSQSQHWACFSELRRELQGGCGDSAGLSVCVREQNISRWVGGGWWAVNLGSTCSLDSGAWCEVSSGRYPIDHIYYIHHSASLFWQLIAPGKEKGRIGFLFKRRGILWAWALSLHFFFFFSARGLQREISHWCWLRVPVRNHNSRGMIFGAQFWKVFLREITLMRKNKKKEILMAHQFSALWQSGCAGLSRILKEQFVFLLLWLISFQ